jgi:decaprenylphospho-beta-D-ribofuranose 2-oxidase
VTVQAGVSLDALMRALLPFGLWVPVLPGTRQVTVGGAIAADVHGKNHHTQGSFGNHVRSLDLLMADGQVRTLTPDQETERLFWATIGGMGLTGAVLTATVALQRTETAYFLVDTDRCSDLDDLMQKMSDGDENYTYSVAWFDAVTRGKHMGRGVLTRGNKATVADLPGKIRGRDPLHFDAPSLGTMPEIFPNRMINKATAKAFSTAWYYKAPQHRVGEMQNITQFFHPLDIVAEWNRVYGPHGFLQYQFVVPFSEADTFRRCVEMIVNSGHLSCLNVLKRFGPSNPAPLSFPMPGWTLTVDLPIEHGLDRLCDALDEQVIAAGGRVYLAKDSRLSAAAFRKMYPRLDEFLAVRREVDPDGIFNSDLARRLEIR